MVIDTAVTGHNLLQALEGLTGQRMVDGLLVLPPTVGQGWLRTFQLSSQVTLLLQHYELTQSLTIRRPAVRTARDAITFSFRDVLTPASHGTSGGTTAHRFWPSVQVSSADIALEIVVPARRPVHAILLTVGGRLLEEWLGGSGTDSPLVQTILSSTQSYVYEHILSGALQQVAAAVFEPKAPQELTGFFLRIKAQELLYLFFVELLNRQQPAVDYPVNTHDALALYRVRDQVIADLGVQPSLAELALVAKMSERKMSRLFRQIFGTSIYEYYQRQRLAEAALLLRQEGWSVSDTGFKLGFTNLSHFAKVFERVHGITPKKYSVS